MESETVAPERKRTPEERLEKYLQEAVAKLEQIGRIRGAFDEHVVAALEEFLHGKVTRECGRLATTEQLPLFADLAKRAEVLRLEVTGSFSSATMTGLPTAEESSGHYPGFQEPPEEP